MTDGNATNPAPEQAPQIPAAQPAPEVVDENTPILADEPELETESDEDKPAEEIEEVDYEGKKYALPKELKEALLRQADYTRKTQEVAESKKGLETERTTFAQQQKALEEHVVGIGKLMSVDEQLARFEKVDWKAWNAQDPVATQAAWIEREQLRQNRDALAGKLHQEWQQKTEAEQRATAKQIADGQAALAREIPNWSPQLANELAQYGKSIGLSEKRLAGIVEPAEVKILHKARMYDQLVAKQRAAAGQPAVPAQPVTQVGARRSPASNEPRDSDTGEEWLRKRNAQVAKRMNGARR